MSKTFKSAYAEHGDQKLNIIGVDDGVRVSADHGSHGAKGIIIATSDAPALALAILDAAGYGEEVVTDGSPDGHIQVAKYYLYEGVKAHASITAEAEAQAKLEAEALELMNVRLRASGTTVHLTKATADPVALEGWLAVARRARELNKEN